MVMRMRSGARAAGLAVLVALAVPAARGQSHDPFCSTSWSAKEGEWMVFECGVVAGSFECVHCLPYIAPAEYSKIVLRAGLLDEQSKQIGITAQFSTTTPGQLVTEYAGATGDAQLCTDRHRVTLSKKEDGAKLFVGCNADNMNCPAGDPSTRTVRYALTYYQVKATCAIPAHAKGINSLLRNSSAPPPVLSSLAVFLALAACLVALLL